MPYDTMRETGFKVAWEYDMKYSVYNLPNVSYDVVLTRCFTFCILRHPISPKLFTISD